MNKQFWNDEYKNPHHLTMSDEPSSDMISFVRWAERNAEWPPFPKGGVVLDIGCGNGRNLIALIKESHMKGYGIDISEEAIRQAKSKSQNFPITFSVGHAEDPLPFLDQSVDVVLDMMTSHFLNQKMRNNLVSEVARVLKPFGWFFFKTFILDDDQNAMRMIKENPSLEESNTYIHPRIKVTEHVWTEEEILHTFLPYFTIHKIIKSHKHIKDGKPYKRRTVSVYMERKRDD